MIGAKVIVILIVVKRRGRETEKQGKRENEKKYTVVMVHTLHVFMCLFSSLLLFFFSVCYITETVFDDVLRIGKNDAKIGVREQMRENAKKKLC
jgi:hypothetical protein